MSFTALADGGSTAISLTKGWVIKTTGSGLATFGPGPMNGQTRGLDGNSTVGPFDYAVTVYLTGRQSPTYEASDPAAFAAALQALVSGAGNGSAYGAFVSGKFASGGTWKTAYAAVMAGTAAKKVLIVGESVLSGVGADSTVNRYRPEGLGKLLPAALNTLSVPASLFTNHFGSGTQTGTVINFWDNRLSTTGTVSVAPTTVGGNVGYGTNYTCTFTPDTGTFDGMDFYYVLDAANGPLTITSSHGTAAVIPTIGARNAGKTTVSFGGPVSSYTITAGGTNAVFIGADCYLSTEKKLRVLNGAWGGSKIADWVNTTNGEAPYHLIPLMAPDLILICIAPNDYIAGTAIATYAANLASLCNTCKAVADTALVTHIPSGTSGASLASQQLYRDAMAGVALALGIPFIDIRAACGSAEGMAGVTGAWMDAYHPPLAIHRDVIAARMADAMQILALR